MLDKYMEDHKQPMGPLHGLPVSLKDQYHVKPNDTTMGYVGWIYTHEGSKDPKLVHNVDSQVVSELLSLGAVLYCKTSLPQTLLLGEMENNIIGRTLNPVNQNLSCTDIGGSARIPAAFCGIFSVKPSHNRLSYRQVANTNPGQDTYASSVGVMGASLGAVGLVLKSLISTQPWLRDPSVVPIPWRQQIVEETLGRNRDKDTNATSKPLKLGVYWDDGVVTPHPPVARELRIVAEAVEKAGHKVTTRPGAYMMQGLTGLGHGLDSAFTDNSEESAHLTIEGKAYCESFSDYWNSTSVDDGQIVDAVIMPVAPHATVIPGKYYHTGKVAPDAYFIDFAMKLQRTLLR
ncbi:hypothetical protein LTR36_010202 [Oleoguttula mirabilis]|uniref:Amidase domain-containing protein n=1 Tax=Oleoguttula mirabilis TaxID=1507867 RepID=A0AAV9JTK7_9PEZI|nr:hypothetical protein LTR36_010202 [Oleoguttula mirabilis]